MKKLYIIVFSIIASVCIFNLADVHASSPFELKELKNKDTTENEVDSIVYYDINPTKFSTGTDTLKITPIVLNPLISVQQMLKGGVAGVYVQEPSGEPGDIDQGIYIRGVNRPVLNQHDIHQARPAVFLNGIPLIQDNSFVYNVQAYDVSPIGPATNLLSTIDLDNIESVSVLKDYKQAGLYGPRAANGAIFITTKNASPGVRQLSVNSYFGFAEAPQVTTFNSEFEKEFRLPFYYRYGTQQDLESMPAYLSDSSNVNYYGPSNWTDSYYSNTPLYSVNGSLSGGSDRSNFRFFGGHTRSAASADDAKLNRYTGSFFINMLPAKWLTISSMINANRLDRDRNRNFRDRYAEMRFLPDLSNPMSPNKTIFNGFHREYDKVIDDNTNNSIQGYLSLNANVGNFNYSPRLSFDYNEGRRDVFWPGTLFNGSSYVSNYFGYNQRLIIDNIFTYKHDLNTKSKVNFEGGISYQADIQRYNYAYGYNGPNDFIKINVVSGNKNNSTYMQPNGFITYNFTDKMQQRLLSFYGRATYAYKDEFELSGLLRTDGSSAMQPSHRWFTSGVVSADYHLKSKIKSDFFNRLDIGGSFGRMGNLRIDERVGAGPQYGAQLGWEGNSTMASYNGFGTMSRPYNSGWVGYDIPWSYTDILNVGTEISILNNLFTLKADGYIKNSKEMILEMPTVSESGYKSELGSGMWVENKGIDVTFSSQILSKRTSGFSWNGSVNIAYNKNELKALPNNLDEIVIGSRKLKVGEPVDRFWLLENEGVYKTDMDVPVNPANYEILSYNGVAMKGGDPRWKDQNGDFKINDQDKVLTGNIMPSVTGGLFNQFQYKNFDLNFHFHFALGKKALNQRSAQYYDFINVDRGNDLGSIREITFWEQNFNTSDYPLYNPWSDVNPYQVEQDMFLEDASFFKMRSLSLGYELSNLPFIKNKKTVNKLYVYVTGTNLFTITPYSGRDPELINFLGYDTGYGLPIPRSYVLGVKLDL